MSCIVGQVALYCMEFTGCLCTGMCCIVVIRDLTFQGHKPRSKYVREAEKGKGEVGWGGTPRGSLHISKCTLALKVEAMGLKVAILETLITSVMLWRGRR